MTATAEGPTPVLMTGVERRCRVEVGGDGATAARDLIDRIEAFGF